MGLEAYGIEIVDRVPVAIQVNKHNLAYMRTKQEKMGHLLEDNALKLDGDSQGEDDASRV